MGITNGNTASGMDHIRDDFEEPVEDDFFGPAAVEESLLDEADGDTSDEDEDELLDQFGLHRVDEEESSEY